MFSRLQFLQRTEPQHFEVLRGLVFGDGQQSGEPHSSAYQESLRYLGRYRDFMKDGSVPKLVRDVLTSSYQLTPDGPALVQPFALTNAFEKAVVDDVEQGIDKARIRWLRRLGPPPSDSGPSI